MLPLLLALSLAAPQTTRVSCDGFAVVFTSPSGDPTEDDEQVEVEFEGQRIAVPVKPNLFTGARARFASPSHRCRDLPVVEVRPGVVVLVLSRSGRPQLDLISFALVDLKKRKTLAVVDTNSALASGRVEKAGEVEFSFVLRDAKGGFDVRAVREWLPQDDTLAGAMEDWLAVRVRGERLEVDWLRR